MEVGWELWKLGRKDGGWVGKMEVGWEGWRLGGKDGGWVGRMEVRNLDKWKEKECFMKVNMITKKTAKNGKNKIKKIRKRNIQQKKYN